MPLVPEDYKPSPNSFRGSTLQYHGTLYTTFHGNKTRASNTPRDYHDPSHVLLQFAFWSIIVFIVFAVAWGGWEFLRCVKRVYQARKGRGEHIRDTTWESPSGLRDEERGQRAQRKVNNEDARKTWDQFIARSIPAPPRAYRPGNTESASLTPPISNSPPGYEMEDWSQIRAGRY